MRKSKAAVHPGRACARACVVSLAVALRSFAARSELPGALLLLIRSGNANTRRDACRHHLEGFGVGRGPPGEEGEVDGPDEGGGVDEERDALDGDEREGEEVDKGPESESGDLHRDEVALDFAGQSAQTLLGLQTRGREEDDRHQRPEEDLTQQRLGQHVLQPESAHAHTTTTVTTVTTVTRTARLELRPPARSTSHRSFSLSLSREFGEKIDSLFV